MSLTIFLRNHTESDNVWAYVTGQDINQGGSLVLLESDGQTLYHPTSPSATLTPPARPIAIQLPGPRRTRQIHLPTYIKGGRVYFSIGDRLTFYINPGPALVEPSVTNATDPNHYVRWDFCEFTFNPDQLYANITYVDFMSIPIALTLYHPDGEGGPQHVSGTTQYGLSHVVAGLRDQAARDGQPWTSLIQSDRFGAPLRALSLNSAIAAHPSLFASYYADYVTRVWHMYAAAPLTINTQASFGAVSGRVAGGRLYIGGQSFGPPLTADIATCSTGPFATGASLERNAIIPRIAAAFNRSTLLLHAEQPNGVPVSDFYKTSPTNHYARIVHEANLDKKGYAFPYDDVTGTGREDVSGAVMGKARVWIIAVGGNGAGLPPAKINPPLTPEERESDLEGQP